MIVDGSSPGDARAQLEAEHQSECEQENLGEPFTVDAPELVHARRDKPS
jgi:hypothetical protein